MAVPQNGGVRRLADWRVHVAAALVFFTVAGVARADDEAMSPAPVHAPSQPMDQMLYKGFVGNLLDHMPLDPEQRVQMQRGSAVVSNVLSGRTLGMLLGATNPVFMIGGLMWGIVAASRIESARASHSVLAAGPQVTMTDAAPADAPPERGDAAPAFEIPWPAAYSEAGD